MGPNQPFQDRYLAIAAEYLSTEGEAELYQASLLGREMVGAGLGPLEATELHFHVVEALGEEGRATRSEALWPVFLEVITAFEQSHRAVRDLVRTLEDRCRDLESARSQVQDTSRYLENLIRSMNDGLMVLDAQGLIQDVNPAVLGWLRSDKAALIGRPVSSVFASAGEAPLVGERLQELLRLGNVRNATAVFESGTGERIPVSLSASVLYDREGGVTGVVVIARDVTEVTELIAELEASREQLRAKTAQLIQTEKMKALGELAAGVAHELNQPLNAVRLTCEDLVRDVRRDRLRIADVDEGLSDVVVEVRKMAEIIDHMRIFSRRTEGMRRELLDASLPVRGVLRLLGQQLRDHGVEVATSFDDLSFVLADPVRLEQVLMNLVANARDAVSANSPERGRRVRVIVRRLDGNVAYEVVDNGCGIAEELVQRIFEPFFTTKVPGQGTGLGLSVSAEIVAEHGGTITAESRPGEGTTFRVALPLADPGALANEEPEE